jgi:hypothetical protein
MKFEKSIIKLICILTVGFVLLFGNVQQINFLSIQNRKSINLTAENSGLQLKKETLLQQNNNKFMAEIDKKIEKNEIQQTVIGAAVNKETFDEVFKNQQNQINVNNTTVVAR